MMLEGPPCAPTGARSYPEVARLIRERPSRNAFASYGMFTGEKEAGARFGGARLRLEWAPLGRLHE